MKLRPPATPIFTVDPYFSLWTEDSPFHNTVHWTGKPNTSAFRLFLDGTEYHLLGWNPPKEKALPTLPLVKTEIDAFTTSFYYESSSFAVTLHLTSPCLIEDLELVSRPVCYCKAEARSLDGAEHKAALRLIFSEELVLNSAGEGRALADAVSVPGLTVMKMGNGIQNPLWRSGDDIRIDWGYLYLGIRGEGRTGHQLLNGLYAAWIEADLSSEALFLVGYDDVQSILYFNKPLLAYWKKDGKTMEEAMSEAAAEYESVLLRCQEFSERIRQEALTKGNEEYADLLLLAYRQVMAAHKAVVEEDGTLLYISKECNSNGCAATVDVTYPSAPLYLKYNPELLKGMLRPVMRYAASEEWVYDFAPHDVGRYPILDGQRYGVTRDEYGVAVKILSEKQMPVEECGNMIILFEAIAEADQSTDFVDPHRSTLAGWCQYLIRYGEDPEHQLCTDDFAGHLAHNVNLSIKAIMGIAAYSRLLKRWGEEEEAQKMMEVAKEYTASLLRRAANDDGSWRLAYDRPDTFSLKYNALWDRLWNTELFPEAFFQGEGARYRKEMLPYGVPLDSREAYTKSDWLIWVATMCQDKALFDEITSSLWRAYHTMRSWAPMTDWYYCDTSHMRKFRHRSVQGGLFVRLLFS